MLTAREITSARYQLVIESAFDDGTEWQVVAIALDERLNHPYQLDVELETDDPTATGANMLGASCELVIDRTAQLRRVRGLVARVEQVGSHEGGHRLRARIVSALGLLDQRRDSRIFQGRTVPEVVEEVLSSALSTYGRRVELDLRREYAPREYCVQYDESDLAFVERLLEEEGIGYWFNHDAVPEEGREEGELAERLVLTDDNASFGIAETAAAMPGSVTLASRSDELADREGLFTFDYAAELRPTRVALRDYDWTRPSLDTGQHAGEGDHLDRQREIYAHREPIRFHGYDEAQRRYTEDDGVRQSFLHHDAHVLRGKMAAARGNVVGLFPGVTFKLEGHGNADLNIDWLVVEARHRGTAGVDESEDEATPAYESTIRCIPAEVTWVPERRTRRPRIHGYETATVVGPAGEEIHTDPHGRIKARFHWDRSGITDERASCWLRVQQTWAGPGYGAIFTPRVGMEVVVLFQGGNPDRPLVTGCVYNGQNTPQLDLPDERTQSILRTASSPGGAGYNEIRFEDAAGSELFAIHAQRNMTETVRADHSVSVGGDESIHVRGKREETIEETLTQTVTGTRTYNVTGAGSNFDIDVAQGHLYGNAETAATFKSGIVKLRLQSDGSLAHLHVGTKASLSLKPDAIELEIGRSRVRMTEDKIEIDSPEIDVRSSDGAKVWLKDSALLTHSQTVRIATEKSDVRLNGSVIAADCANLELDGNKGVAISSVDVKIQGETGVELAGGGATARLKGGNVDLNQP